MFQVLTLVEKKKGLTTSRQVVLRWIRQGDLPAVQETRKKVTRYLAPIWTRLSQNKRRPGPFPKKTAFPLSTRPAIKPR